MRRVLPLTVLASSALLGCAHKEPTSAQSASNGDAGSSGAEHAVVFEGANVLGHGVVDVRVERGVIVALGQNLREADDQAIAVDGFFLAPAAIDSHVHLSYYPVASELRAHGVAAALDLAAPLASFGTDTGGLVLLRSGPMLTAPGGYPTTSWGQDGYGLEVSTSADARQRVRELVSLGADVIKVPLAGAPELSDDVIAAIVDEAHQAKKLVVAHALQAAAAERAASLGCDVLAHTPTEPLPDAVVAAWSDKAVISTLAAFGGSGSAVDNLRALRAQGTRVLYGTDLGNLRDVGVSESELRLLAEAGMQPEDVLASLGSEPATFWRLTELGSLDVGKRASFLVLEGDPLAEPTRLAHPDRVYMDGVEMKP